MLSGEIALKNNHYYYYYVIDTVFKQLLLNLMFLEQMQTPSFPSWVIRPHQSAVNVAKLNFSDNVCHLQQ